MNDEKRFYNVNPIIEYARKINCPFIGIAGGKGNGKTYGLIEWALHQYFETGRCLRYLRRYAESIKPKAIQSLCKPQRQTLINLSGGRFNDFSYYQNRFYPVRIDEHGKKVEKGAAFIICSALNSVEAFTGADEGECSAIFYDEFLSREKELDDEYYNTMIFHNNCVRNRTDYFCPFFLVGNTVTRNSALIKDFGVNLYDMKQGEITLVKNSDDKPVIVFELCSAVEVMTEAAETYYNRFNNNDRIKMIYKGDWTIANYPHMKNVKNSKVYARIKIITPDNKAIMFEFRHVSNKKIFGYVSEYDNDKLPKLCTLLNGTFLTGYDVFNYLPQKGIFKKFIYLVYTKQVYFSNNETGEKFRDFLKGFNGCEHISTVYK